MTSRAANYTSLLFTVIFLFLVFHLGWSENACSEGVQKDLGRKATVIQNGATIAGIKLKPDSTYELHGVIDLAGAEIIVPDGCFLKGASAALYNGSLVMSNNCTVRDVMFSNVNITFDNKEMIRISNCTFSGDFEGGVIPEQNYAAAAIYGNSGKDVFIDSVIIKNYQWGISVFKCNRVNIEDVSFVGILYDSIDYTRTIQNSNYHDAVHLAGTNESRVTHVVAANCGACVLLGGTSKFNVIENCSGKNLWDNGVYISSGNDNVVRHCEFNHVRGTGVKARGSRNIIINNTVSCVGTGYGITGCGNSIGLDEYGQDYNGEGSYITDNIVKDAHDVGIAIASHGGYPPYRFSIDNNRIVNGPNERASISVFCNNARVTGNEVDCPTSYGIVVSQIPDRTSGGYIISNNKITCNRKGIVVQKCTNAMVHDNSIDVNKQGILVFETAKSSFIHNGFAGKGKYAVSGHVKGQSNYYKTLGENDALKPSEYIILDKR